MAAHETEAHTGHVDMEEEFGLGARMAKSLVKGIVTGLPIGPTRPMSICSAVASSTSSSGRMTFSAMSRLP